MSAKRVLAWGGAAVAAVIAFVICIVMVLAMFFIGSDEAQSTAMCDASTVVDGADSTYSPAQLQYVQQIVAAGRELGISDRGIQIALMTVLVESHLKNYANSNVPSSLNFAHDAVGSDHDSVGLFQQRPASGWGTVEELMTISYQAKAFFGGPEGPNGGSPRGLLDIPGWESMEMGAAAQAVQVSAFPDRYTEQEAAAKSLLTQVGGNVVCTPESCPVEWCNDPGQQT